MYPIETEVVSLGQAEHRYHSEFPIRDFHDTLLKEHAAVSSHANVTLRHGFGYAERRESTFIFLRDTLLPEVPSLARNHFSVRNDHSADLMENHTYLEFFGDHVRVRVRADSLGSFTQPDEMGSVAFDIVFVCGPLVFISTHRPSAENAELITADLQGCSMGAGCNYNPYRLWTEEQLMTAKQRRRAPPHGLITALAFEPAHDWRAILGFPCYA